MKKVILLFSVFNLLFSINVYASFEPIGIGPRPIGLSNAYTAVSDDAYSVCYNPSGLTRLKRAEITTYYGSLYSGLSDGSNLSQLFIAYGQPLEKIGNLGLGYYSFTLAEWYSESILTLSYARNISLDKLGARGLDLGLSMKFLGKTYSDPEGHTKNSFDEEQGMIVQGNDDPVFANGYGMNGTTFDFGMQFSPSTGYNIGFAILNLTEPDMGLKDADKVSQEIKFGVARESKDVLISVDLSTRKFVDTEFKLAFGAEKYFKGGLGIRGGLAIGARQYTQLSAGIAYRVESLQFDYGLLLPLSGISSSGCHRIGLTFRFGKVYDVGRVELEKEIAARLKAEREAKKAGREAKKARSEVERMLHVQKELEKALKKSEQARIKEAKTKKVKVGTKKSSLVAEYVKALNYYNSRVSEGINLGQRKNLLSKIVNRFKNKGIDLTVVNREFSLVKKQYNESKKNYRISMDYYKRVISKTAPKNEKIELLQSILKKYKKTGIDLNDAEKELKKLQGK